MADRTIPKRISGAILAALAGGVVPGAGLEHITVGRKKEVSAILSDLQKVQQGGAAFRFVVGRYGSGKSFMLNLVKRNALERDFLVADADLSPQRRLAGTKGQGLATYRELMGHLSTKTRPGGGALEVVLQKWIAGVQHLAARDGIPADDPRFAGQLEWYILDLLSDMQSSAYGYDLARVLTYYARGIRQCSERMRHEALRWLRGEYAIKREARALGVNQIITDDSWYDFLKLFARLSVRAGYRGLIVLIDEGVNLSKISNHASRDNNYEKLATMLGDVAQGRAPHMAVLLGGTDQFVEDPRCGLYSYEPLKARLDEGRGKPGPILRLATLTYEEIYLLLERISQVFCAHHGVDAPLTDGELLAFMEGVASHLRADQLLTPREVTRDFIPILELKLQNPRLTFHDLVAQGKALVRPAQQDPDALDGSESSC